MAKFHISSDGNPRVCSASEGKCPLGGNENHYTSKEAARAAYEESAETLVSVSKKNRSENSDSGFTEYDKSKEWFKGAVYRRDPSEDRAVPEDVIANMKDFWSKISGDRRDSNLDEELPEIENADDSKSWFKNFGDHREASNDQPAPEEAANSKDWYKGAKDYRENV